MNSAPKPPKDLYIYKHIYKHLLTFYLIYLSYSIKPSVVMSCYKFTTRLDLGICSSSTLRNISSSRSVAVPSFEEHLISSQLYASSVDKHKKHLNKHLITCV